MPANFAIKLNLREELKIKTPIIAMSANFADVEKDNCMKMGMNDYVTKPFDKKDLFKSINYFLKDKIEGLKNNQEVCSRTIYSCL